VADFNIIRTKLRFLGRLLTELHFNENGSFWDFLIPKKYEAVKMAVSQLGKQSAQMSIQISHYIKRLATLKVGIAIVIGDEESQKNAENFLKLYESNWWAEI